MPPVSQPAVQATHFVLFSSPSDMVTRLYGEEPALGFPYEYLCGCLLK